MRHTNWKGLQKALAAATVALLVVGVSTGQDRSTGDIIEGDLGAELRSRLEPIVRTTMDDFDLPGLGVGVVECDRIVYARGFGFENIETRKPVTVRTMFHMASVSKVFVATAIMRLVESNKVELDAPVVEYLPYFEMRGELYTRISIRQMLSHTSGMPDVNDSEWDGPEYDDRALERFVRSLSQMEMTGTPGGEFSYSNLAFECLGDVIAKAAGMSFEDYVKETVLDPSGMINSTFLKPPDLPENWASPHVRSLRLHAWSRYPYNRKYGPSSTLHSNVLEMCSWAMANMRGPEGDGQTILDESSYAELWSGKVKTGIGGVHESVGLGWFVGHRTGERTVGHGGRDTGFNTSLIMTPERGIAVVVLCNYSPAPATALAEAALDIALGQEPRTLRPPASLPVLGVLADQGVEAAVREWRRLRREKSSDYDFSEKHLLFSAGAAALLDRVEDARVLAELCQAVLSEASLRFASNYMESFLRDHPGNRAAAAMCEILGQ